MDGTSIATAVAVFIAGILTYEYSMWRTKRTLKKMLQPYLPLIATLTPKNQPKKKPEDYE